MLQLVTEIHKNCSTVMKRNIYGHSVNLIPIKLNPHLLQYMYLHITTTIIVFFIIRGVKILMP